MASFGTPSRVICAVFIILGGGSGRLNHQTSIAAATRISVATGTVFHALLLCVVPAARTSGATGFPSKSLTEDRTATDPTDVLPVDALVPVPSRARSESRFKRNKSARISVAL